MEPTDSASALFVPDGPNRWVPTGLARGPWDPRACHGGPVSALLARAVEHADPDSLVDWQIARLTIELTRPVPVESPLTVTTDIERDGRKVSLVAVRLHDGDTEVARARSLRIRAKPLALPDTVAQPASDPPATPHDAVAQRVSWATGDQVAFHTHACEHRFTEGSWDAPGPVGEWIGMRSASHYGTTGTSTGAGFAESALYDAEGRMGRSVQSLILDER